MLQPISAKEKHAMYQYRIHQSTVVQQFKIPVCHAIYKVLSREHMKVPSTKDKSMEIINKVYEKWNFPNVYAADPN